MVMHSQVEAWPSVELLQRRAGVWLLALPCTPHKEWTPRNSIDARLAHVGRSTRVLSKRRADRDGKTLTDA